MKKLSLITLAVSFSLFSTGVMAETVSGQSQSYDEEKTDIIVGETQSTRGPHGGALGAPGIGYRNMRDGMRISFSGLKNLVTQKPDNVYVLESSGSPHGNMGKFQFSQVADAEIYYGDWSQTGLEGDKTHTAYFSGENASTEVPVEGKATYTLEGVNQYDGEAKLAGSFEADFGEKTYIGSLQGASNSYTMAGELEEQGKFSGTAVANDSIDGTSKGQFFGDNADSMAGVTSFAGNEELDIAFAGKKD
ncbi:TPA: Slam-dependent surface lipoprotein [Providencia rettgeri]